MVERERVEMERGGWRGRDGGREEERERVEPAENSDWHLSLQFLRPEIVLLLFIDCFSSIRGESHQ